MTSCRTILRATLWFAMSLFAPQQPAHAALVTARFEGRVSEISFTQFGDPVIAPTETTGLLPNSLGDSGIVMLSATYDDSIPDGNPFGASYQDSFTALSLNLQHNSSDGSVAPAIPPEGLNYELSTPRSSTVQMFNDLPTGGPGYLDFLLASMGIDGRRLGHTSIPAFRTWVPYSLDLEFAIESATPSSALLISKMIQPAQVVAHAMSYPTATMGPPEQEVCHGAEQGAVPARPVDAGILRSVWFAAAV